MPWHRGHLAAAVHGLPVPLAAGNATAPFHARGRTLRAGIVRAVA